MFDFKRLWNASHIYACTYPKPKIYGYGRNVHLRHFPWPKRPWPKCPGRNVLGRNVRGRNVRAPVKCTGRRNPYHFDHAASRKLDAVKFHSLWWYNHLSSRFFFCTIKSNHSNANRRQVQQNYKHVVFSSITTLNIHQYTKIVKAKC